MIVPVPAASSWLSSCSTDRAWDGKQPAVLQLMLTLPVCTGAPAFSFPSQASSAAAGPFAGGCHTEHILSSGSEAAWPAHGTAQQRTRKLSIVAPADEERADRAECMAHSATCRTSAHWQSVSAGGFAGLAMGASAPAASSAAASSPFGRRLCLFASAAHHLASRLMPCSASVLTQLCTQAALQAWAWAHQQRPMQQRAAPLAGSCPSQQLRRQRLSSARLHLVRQAPLVQQPLALWGQRRHQAASSVPRQQQVRWALSSTSEVLHNSHFDPAALSAAYVASAASVAQAACSSL